MEMEKVICDICGGVVIELNTMEYERMMKDKEMTIENFLANPEYTNLCRECIQNLWIARNN
jgi:hypothetical protein